MAYTSFYAGSTGTTDKPKTTGYTSLYGNTVQATQAQGGNNKKKKQTEEESVRQATEAGKKLGEESKKRAAEQQKTSLFSKVRSAAKDLVVEGVAKPVAKSLNTIDAGKQALAGGVVATGLRLAGKKEASDTVAKITNKVVDTTLTKGLGNQGGYLKPKQAESGGTGAKGLKEDFIKPATKAVAEVAPLVVPAGRTAKGASLFTKVSRGAVDNAVISAGADAANQAVEKGKVDLKQTGQAAATGAVFGAAFPAAGAVINKFKKSPNSLPEAMLNKAEESLAAKPKPGDIIEPFDPKNPSEKHITATQAVIDRAKIEDPVFQTSVKGVADELGLKYHAGPPKDLERALAKTMHDYEGDPSKLKDTIRATIEVPDHQGGFKQVIDSLEAKYPGVKIKDGYKDYKRGYADMKVTITTKDGHKGEIILATPEMLDAKNKQGGHELYEISRDQNRTPSERKAAADQMAVLYANAHDAANKRLASSGDLPASSTKQAVASSKVAGTEPSTIAPTSADSPVTTTVSVNKPEGSSRTDSTTSSGVIKNDGDVSIPSTIAKNEPNVKDKGNQSGKASRVYERLQAEHPELEGNVQYTPIKLKEEAEKAAKLIESDKNQAYRIAMGAEVSDDITSTATNIALAEKALQDGNTGLYAQLVKNRSLAQTRRGQEIVSEKGSVTDNSTSRYVKEVIAMRLDKLGKGFTSGIDTSLTKSDKQRAIAKLDKEVTKAQKQIKTKQFDIKSAQALIDSLAC